MILRLLTIAIIAIQAVACATSKPVEQKSDPIPKPVVQDKSNIIIWEERKDLLEPNLVRLIPSWERDQISCKRAKEQNSINGWQQYMEQYPKGKCKAQALKSIATIKKQKADQLACSNSQQQNSIKGWQRYLKQYPKGKCKPQALKSITAIKKRPLIISRIKTAQAGLINDTGISWGGNYEKGNNPNCTGETIEQQDCSWGRDSEAAKGKLKKLGAGKGGFDFIKIAKNGTPLDIQNKSWLESGSELNGTKWSCVFDNRTGLLWEVKTNDGSVHDKDNKYRWGGKTAQGKNNSNRKGKYYDDWDQLVNGTNRQRLCGFSDWRVPAIYELVTITNKKSYNPAIDDDYFPNSGSNWYWSSSPNAINSNEAWFISFSNGSDNTYYRDSKYLVRLVRGRQ